jgi:hypothetical protein
MSSSLDGKSTAVPAAASSSSVSAILSRKGLLTTAAIPQLETAVRNLSAFAFGLLFSINSQ